MKTMGLDLSINSTGICINNQYYIISSKLTKKQMACENKYIHFLSYEKIDDINANLHNITSIIKDLVKKHKPDLVVIEDVAMGATFSRSLIDLTGLNYWTRAVLTQLKQPFITVPPTKWKKELLGNGQADKNLTIDAWKRLDKNIANVTDIKIDDCADAYFLSRFTT